MNIYKSLLIVLFALLFINIGFSQTPSLFSNSSLTANTLSTQHISDAQFLAEFNGVFKDFENVFMYIILVVIGFFLIYGLYKIIESYSNAQMKEIELKYLLVYFTAVASLGLVPFIIYILIGTLIPSLISSLSSVITISSSMITIDEINIIISIAIIMAMTGIAIAIFRMIDAIPKLIENPDTREKAKNDFAKAYYLLFTFSIIPFAIVLVFILATTIFVSVSFSTASHFQFNSSVNVTSSFVPIYFSSYIGCNYSPPLYDIGKVIQCAGQTVETYIASAGYSYYLAVNLFNYAESSAFMNTQTLPFLTNFFMLIFGFIFIYSFAMISYYLLLYTINMSTEREGVQYLMLKDKVKQYVAFLFSPILFIFFVLIINILIGFALTFVVSGNFSPFPALALIIGTPTVTNLALFIAGGISVIFTALLDVIIILFQIIRVFGVIIFPLAIFLYFSPDIKIKEIGKKILIIMTLVFILPTFAIYLYSFWFGFVPSLFSGVFSNGASVVTGTFFNWNIVSNSPTNMTMTHNNMLSTNHQSYTFSCTSQTQVYNVEKEIANSNGFNKANAYSAILVGCGNFITGTALSYLIILILTLLIVIGFILLLIFAPETIGGLFTTIGSTTGLSSISAIGTMLSSQEISSTEKIKQLAKSTASTFKHIGKQTGKYITSSLEGTKEMEVAKAVVNLPKTISSNMIKAKTIEKEKEDVKNAVNNTIKNSGINDEKKAKINELIANGKSYEEALAEMFERKEISKASYDKLMRDYKDRKLAYSLIDTKEYKNLSEDEKEAKREDIYKRYESYKQGKETLNKIMEKIANAKNESTKEKIITANESKIREAMSNINKFAGYNIYSKMSLTDLVNESEKENRNIETFNSTRKLFVRNGLEDIAGYISDSNLISYVKSSGYKNLNEFVSNIKKSKQYELASSLENYMNSTSENKAANEEAMLKTLQSIGVSTDVIDKIKNTSDKDRSIYLESLMSISTKSFNDKDDIDTLREFINTSISNQTSPTIMKTIMLPAISTTGKVAKEIVKAYVPNIVEEKINQAIAYGRLVSDSFANVLGDYRPIEIRVGEKNEEIENKISQYNNIIRNLNNELNNAIKNKNETKMKELQNEINKIQNRIDEYKKDIEINNKEVEILNKMTTFKTLMNEVSDWNIAGIDNKLLEYKELSKLAENNINTIKTSLEKKKDELDKIIQEIENETDQARIIALKNEKIKIEKAIEKDEKSLNMYSIQKSGLDRLLSIDIYGIKQEEVEGFVRKQEEKFRKMQEIKNAIENIYKTENIDKIKTIELDKNNIKTDFEGDVITLKPPTEIFDKYNIST
ncbi:MAG: hypothetical protein ACP5IV_07920, partial [Caldisericia bacterium]